MKNTNSCNSPLSFNKYAYKHHGKKRDKKIDNEKEIQNFHTKDLRVILMDVSDLMLRNFLYVSIVVIEIESYKR
jgi:hypothetical protein